MTDLELLDAATECTGHVPEPWAGFLEWVMTSPQTTAARIELRRLCQEVAG